MLRQPWTDRANLKRPATFGQENALRAAKDRLAEGALSKQGLADELGAQGFSPADIRFALNNVQADWYQQAARAAKTYLNFWAYSRQSLIDQLTSTDGDSFALEQAEYGVDNAHLYSGG